MYRPYHVSFWSRPSRLRIVLACARIGARRPAPEPEYAVRIRVRPYRGSVRFTPMALAYPLVPPRRLR